MGKNQTLIEQAFPNSELTPRIKDLSKALDRYQDLNDWATNPNTGGSILKEFRSHGKALLLDIIDIASEGVEPNDPRLINRILDLKQLVKFLGTFSSVAKKSEHYQAEIDKELENMLPDRPGGDEATDDEAEAV